MFTVASGWFSSLTDSSLSLLTFTTLNLQSCENEKFKQSIVQRKHFNIRDFETIQHFPEPKETTNFIACINGLFLCTYTINKMFKYPLECINCLLLALSVNNILHVSVCWTLCHKTNEI